MDNIAIERIASPDLTADTMRLIERYRENDEVIFFLGRLVWQGQMTACVPDMLEIARDPARGHYARIASARAVMSVGDEAQKDALCEWAASQPGPHDRSFAGELVDGAPPTIRAIEQLLRMIEHLEPYQRFSFTGFGRALHGFIDRLPIMLDDAPNQPLAVLIEGVNAYLDRPPYIERDECHVSENHAWLMAPALHAVDRLVGVRAAQALEPASIAVLLKMPAMRFWRSDDVNEYRTALGDNVPRWRELNDKLFWTNVAQVRARMTEKGERLVDDRRVSFLDHFWKLEADAFVRCLGWISDMPEADDRLVALSRCVDLYIRTGRPAAWLAQLRAACAGDPTLNSALQDKIDPRPVPAIQRMEAEHSTWERERDEEKRAVQENRANWIERLKADPDRIRHPIGLEPGAFSNDQYHLMRNMPGDGVTSDRGAQGADWRALIPEFGEPVAEAYRDAAVAYWRVYMPKIRSEGADTSSIPYALIFAMAGLMIEAGEDATFPGGLAEDEARHALRYFTWELNGFPRWFEPLFQLYPQLALDAVKKEIFWELEHSVAETRMHYVVHDIVYHAPWLHATIAPFILDWLSRHELNNEDELRYCLTILAGGGIAAEDLASLAQRKLAGARSPNHRSRWFALWVSAEPSAAIPALSAALEGLEDDAACDFAVHFILALLGGRGSGGSKISSFRTPAHLKSLYVLMHRHIRAAQDINRSSMGAYSPTARDDAQDARNSLFNMLVEIPGAETYAAIKALEQEHPEPEYRRRMGTLARGRAIADADEPPWSVEQVHAFESGLP